MALRGCIGIIGALPQEIALIKQHMQVTGEFAPNASLSFLEGKLNDRPVVVSNSNVGMVFASSVVTTMIERYKVCAVLFTGVAGGLKAGQKIGDIVVAKDLINYSMDCRGFQLPWDPSYKHKLGEIPFANGLCELECDQKMIDLAMKAPHPAGKAYTLGRIVSGSEFLTVDRKQGLKEVWEELGHPDVVEMEGAAVAQICKVYDVPFVVVRAVSDTIEGDASKDFNEFAQEAADELWPITNYVTKHL